MHETDDGKEKLLSLRRLEAELRRALVAKEEETAFYRTQLEKSSEEGQAKLIEQMQKELFESRRMNEEYEGIQSGCNRQWNQLIQENYSK